MKNIIYFLLLPFLMFSCEKEESTNGDNMNGSGKLPCVYDLGISDPITRIEYGFAGSFSEYNYVDGILSEGFDHSLGSAFSVLSKPIEINFLPNDSWEDNIVDVKITNIKTNFLGLMTYGELRISTPENSFYERLEAEYNGDGYLQKFVFTGIEDGVVGYMDVFKYEWSNGNIQKIVYTENWADEETGQLYSGYTWVTQFKYDSGSVKNSGIYLPEMSSDWLELLYYGGFLGKTTNQIPAQIDYVGENVLYVNCGVDSKERVKMLSYSNSYEIKYYYSDTNTEEKTSSIPRMETIKNARRCLNLSDIINRRL